MGSDAVINSGPTPGLYFINAWDCWESGDTADLYLARQLGMLTELMNTSRYKDFGMI